MSGYLAGSGQGLQLVIIGKPKDNMDVINDTNRTSIICAVPEDLVSVLPTKYAAV
jgi:hypothetical protein